MNWKFGSARWILAGFLSLGLHVLILATFVAFSGNRPTPKGPDAAEPEAQAEAPKESERKTAAVDEEAIARAKSASAPTARGEKPAASAPAPAKPQPKPKPISIFEEPLPAHLRDTADDARPRAEERVPERQTETRNAARASEPRAADAKSFYVVKPGDTLTKIVRTTGVSAGELAKRNNMTLSKLEKLRVGQRVRIAPRKP